MRNKLKRSVINIRLMVILLPLVTNVFIVATKHHHSLIKPVVVRIKTTSARFGMRLFRFTPLSILA